MKNPVIAFMLTTICPFSCFTNWPCGAQEMAIRTSSQKPAIRRGRPNRYDLPKYHTVQKSPHASETRQLSLSSREILFATLAQNLAEEKRKIIRYPSHSDVGKGKNDSNGDHTTQNAPVFVKGFMANMLRRYGQHQEIKPLLETIRMTIEEVSRRLQSRDYAICRFSLTRWFVFEDNGNNRKFNIFVFPGSNLVSSISCKAYLDKSLSHNDPHNSFRIEFLQSSGSLKSFCYDDGHEVLFVKTDGVIEYGRKLGGKKELRIKWDSCGKLMSRNVYDWTKRGRIIQRAQKFERPFKDMKDAYGCLLRTQKTELRAYMIYGLRNCHDAYVGIIVSLFLNDKTQINLVMAGKRERKRICDIACETLDSIYKHPFGKLPANANQAQRDARVRQWREWFHASLTRIFGPEGGPGRKIPKPGGHAAQARPAPPLEKRAEAPSN